MGPKSNRTGIFVALAVACAVTLPTLPAMATSGVTYRRSSVHIASAVAGHTSNVSGMVRSRDGACRPHRKIRVTSPHETVVVTTDLAGHWQAGVTLFGGETVVAALSSQLIRTHYPWTACGGDRTTSQATARYTLTTDTTLGEGSGTVSCGGAVCPHEWNSGQNISLTAVPSEGSIFAAWDDAGPCAGFTQPTCNFQIFANTAVGVKFDVAPPGQPIYYNLTIDTTLGDGTGSVECDTAACPSQWLSGSTVSLTAVPDDGSVFGAWDEGGTCAGVTQPTCTFTITKDTTVGVWFEIPRAPGNTFLHLVSDDGDYIGQGATYDYQLENAHILPSVSGNKVTLSIRGDQWWDAQFELPSSYQTVIPGQYDNATRYPFNDPAVPGLSFYGEGRGCNTLTGWFAVDGIGFVNGVLDHLSLRFEQHCENAVAALHGTLGYDKDDVPVFTDPGPAPDWQPTVEVPSGRSYLAIESNSGDWVGQGQHQTYTTSNGTFSVLQWQGQLQAHVADWMLNAKLPERYTQAQVGYYPDLRRYGFNNPVTGGLDFYGYGRGCNELTGWIAIDDIGYDPDGTLDHLTLRFEQDCEFSMPPLHGKLVYDNDFPA